MSMSMCRSIAFRHALRIHTRGLAMGPTVLVCSAGLSPRIVGRTPRTQDETAVMGPTPVLREPISVRVLPALSAGDRKGDGFWPYASNNESRLVECKITWSVMSSTTGTSRLSKVDGDHPNARAVLMAVAVSPEDIAASFAPLAP
jgi:hypothetical protein